MPGRSAAPSRTVDLITASCASLVGCRSPVEIPRVILALTSHAHRGRTTVDRVCRDELRAASMTRLSAPSVRVELLDEGTALATRVAVVAEACPAGVDCLVEHANNRVAQSLSFPG